MNHQALARQWRPRHFQEMVGQESTVRMLTHALEQQRLHHAYLFTGTRGVGKTTLARIFAKSLNCEKGITAMPCGQCAHCTAVDNGRFLDLIEIDAASNTKVEDTRELLDKVHYPPLQGRYKIYLIDEVHMLSGHSFNALLKTLEEPPEYVKFLLATTDPKRLPVTVLSRCLQFHLKRIPTEQITHQLAHICEKEKLIYELPALSLIADAADGSLRDGLSLLDQAIAFCHGKIVVSDMRDMLGCVEERYLLDLLQALMDGDGKGIFAVIEQLANHVIDFNPVLNGLLSLLHEVNKVQLINRDKAHNIDSQNKIILFAKKLSPEDVQLYYQIALIGRRDLPLAPHPRMGFEMVMLRMLAFRPVPRVSRVSGLEGVSKNTKVEAETKTKVKVELKPETKAEREKWDWDGILSQLKLTGMAQALASNCILIDKKEEKITLGLSTQHEAMLNKKLTDRIEQALTAYFKQSILLFIQVVSKAKEIETPFKQEIKKQAVKQEMALEAMKKDSTVQTIIDTFGANIDEATVKSLS